MTDALFDGPVPPMHPSLIVQRGVNLVELAGKFRMVAACADQVTVVMPACAARRIAQALLRDDLSTKIAAPLGVVAGGGAGASFESIRETRDGGGGFWKAHGAIAQAAPPSPPVPLMSAELQGKVAKARAKWRASLMEAAIPAIYLGIVLMVAAFWVWVLGWMWS